MKRSLLAIAVCIAVTGSVAHAAAKSENATSAPKSLPSVSAASQDDSSLSGKVVETMNAGGYTYVCIEKNAKKTWVAVPITEIKVGQQVTFIPGTEMGNFTSKTLNKTFDNIIFSTGLASAPGAAPKKAATSPQASKAAAPASTEKIKVEKATGPNAFTIREIYEKLSTLNQKPVVVRGKVVKVSEGIMGKNWIHLQDGTGDITKGNNKLVVTSQDLPAMGDVITVKGTMYKDKDFGSGYRYNAIMEQATIQR